ncbi:hairy-related 12 [Denticeps clupeoides]|uniref:Transcription factor HES-5 n=1 Tax=Denticeps clupeoides TaxID=299321 RepID=A0AAY4DEE7_9TELE|nr:transcription factor HES-5-like [Denticeps clupeoides]
MAPYTSALPAHHHLGLPDKDRIKLRKPVVEKMRRDRINNCIDQLKMLLEKEILSQDPNVKLEKADVLEMTVNFLKKRQTFRPAANQVDYSHGYSQCWRDSVHFLSNTSCSSTPSQHTQSVQRDTRDHHSSHPAAHKLSSAVQEHTASPRAVWRPW